MKWEEGRLTKAMIYACSGGICRVSTLGKVKITGVDGKPVESGHPARGFNPNGLNTAYGVPPYEKDKSAKLVGLPVEKRYNQDFKTEKGRTYILTPK